MSSVQTPSPAPSEKARDKNRPKQKLLARLIVLNMLGLLILAGGILTLSESRQVLTRAYTKSLQTQASIIASALSQATQQNNFEFFEPSILKQLNGRRTNTWRVRQAQKIMRDMRNVTDARLRLYANNGNLIIDSGQLDRSINVVSRDLPPLLDSATVPSWLETIKSRGQHFIFGAKPVLNEITAADGFRLPEVAAALKGQAASLQRQNENGHDVLTVAVPVQGYRAIVGALMISTHPGEIDAIIAE